jgi:adenylate cyclase
MSPEVKKAIQLEIAHVLFIDIVGYSKLLITEQSEQIQKLKEIVRGTEQVRLAEAEGKLLRLPTGDGGALVFRTSPEAPVLCAMEIAKALKSHPEVRVRMGIHSGPVNEVADLNEQANIAGAGINIAQRVMNCGDPGHILLSKRVADDLEQYPQWRSLLHDLGEFEVKHGLQIRVVNFYGDEIGNPQVPKKLQFLKKHRARTRWTAIATALLLLAGIVAAFVIVSKKSEKLASNAPEKSIAVLPFVDMSQGKDQEYFSDGIAEELLNRLAQLPDLKVAARTSAFQFRGKSLDMADIGRQLKVANVLEGSVRKSGANLRITAQLIQCNSGYHLWSQTFDRDASDVFKVQGEIASAITDALNVRLGGRAGPAKLAASAEPAASADPVAYDDYLQARALLARRAGDNLKLAVAAFDRAIARDPNYSPAHSGRAFTLIVSVGWAALLPMEELCAAVIASANEALRLDPENAEGYLVRGMAKSALFRENEARADFDRAYALAPGSVNVINLLGDNYFFTGNLRAAERMKRQAMALDPLAFVHPLNLAGILRAQGRFSDAEAMARRAQALDDHAFAYDELFRVQLGLGKLDAARQSLATLCSKVGTEGRGCLIETVALYVAEGRPAAEMAPMLARLSADDWHGIDTTWLSSDVASLYANQLHNIPKATAAMRESLASLEFYITPPLLYGSKGPRLPEEISPDPKWLAFWADPKLRQLMDTYRANLTAFRNGK